MNYSIEGTIAELSICLRTVASHKSFDEATPYVLASAWYDFLLSRRFAPQLLEDRRANQIWNFLKIHLHFSDVITAGKGLFVYQLAQCIVDDSLEEMKDTIREGFDIRFPRKASDHRETD